MNDIDQLIPRGKADLDRARAAVQSGYPAVAAILPELTAWLKDYNWPVAHIVAPFLASIGPPLVPHIWHVLNPDDGVWKCWILQLLIPFLPEDVAFQFLPEIKRLCNTPSEDERREGLDQQARDVLAHFGWL
jgi:Domain of unknown function (DUF5071)